MELFTQIVAILAPLVLALMGLVLSIRPTKKARYWIAAFLVVGAGSFWANFSELRSTNNLQKTVAAKQDELNRKQDAITKLQHEMKLRLDLLLSNQRATDWKFPLTSPFQLSK